MRPAANGSAKRDPQRIRAIFPMDALRDEIDAASVAAAVADEDHGKEMLSVLSFRSSGVRYLVEASYVYEVLTGKGLTSVPNAPSRLLGITELRGHLVPVFDLAAVGGRAEGFMLGRSHIVLFGTERGEFGILADCLPDFAEVPVDTIPLAGEGSLSEAKSWARRMLGGTFFLHGPDMMNDPVFSIE